MADLFNASFNLEFSNVSNRYQKLTIMVDRVIRQQEAFAEALEYCKIYGLDWRTHVMPKYERNEISGYYVLDETLSTSVKIINL